MSVQTTISFSRKIEFWDGFRFAWGAFCFLGLALILSQTQEYFWPHAFDDSDAPPARSGLRIKTDNLTGCQYLVTMTGITPRVNRDGKQVCK